MDNSIQAIFVLVGAAFSAMVVGGSLIFGIATVCRWIGWAPVNLNVHIHNHFDAQGSDANE